MLTFLGYHGAYSFGVGYCSYAKSELGLTKFPLPSADGNLHGLLNRAVNRGKRCSLKGNPGVPWHPLQVIVVALSVRAIRR